MTFVFENLQDLFLRMTDKKLSQIFTFGYLLSLLWSKLSLKIIMIGKILSMGKMVKIFGNLFLRMANISSILWKLFSEFGRNSQK